MKHITLNTLRKVLALATVLLLLLSLGGCWKKEDPDSTDDTSGQLPPASTADTTAAPEVPTEAETQPPTEAPDIPTEAPATEAPADKRMGTVLPEKLNIRKEPSLDSAKAGYYIKNDRIEILETRNGWGRTTHGWVWLEYVDLNASGTEPEDTTAELITDGSTKALGNGVVTLGTLNVRLGPGSNYEKVGTVSLGSRHAFFQKSANWARIEEGWISLSYFYVEGTTGEGAGTGTIIGTNLNIRSGPGTDFDKVGSYKEGEKVEILAQVNKWGYTEEGWISMAYVEMDASTARTGTVIPESLNIRKEADVNSEKVGSYKQGETIKILEEKNGWGRTDKGWVYLEYVKMEESVKKTGTVTATSLYIRKEADKSSEAVGAYKQGDKVEILETKDGWGRTDKGWIYLEYVKLDK